MQASCRQQIELIVSCHKQCMTQPLEGLKCAGSLLPLALQVVVISLPIMVEDPQHAANKRAHKYSTALAQRIQQKYPSVAFVDFQSACRQHMAQHSTAWQQALQEAPDDSKSSRCVLTLECRVTSSTNACRASTSPVSCTGLSSQHRVATVPLEQPAVAKPAVCGV